MNEPQVPGIINPPVPPVRPVVPGGDPFAAPVTPGVPTPPATPEPVVMAGVEPVELAGAPEMPPGSETLPATDSFGQPITPAEVTAVNGLPAEPIFEHGMLSGPPKVESTTPPSASKDDKQAKKSGGKSEDGLPMPVILVIYMVIVCLVGIAVYFLWYYQYEQIQTLKQAVIDRDTQVQTLKSDLTKTQDQIKLSSASPVYVSPDGGFSFFQDTPGLVVTADGKTVQVAFGPVSGETPTDGFVMKIAEELLGGLSLSRIVDDAIAVKVAGRENVDKRAEVLADNVGFSYVETDGVQDRIIYFLQKNMNDPSYIRIEYVIGGADGDAEYGRYEETALDLIDSLKIY